jgi:hypothetical protein
VITASVTDTIVLVRRYADEREGNYVSTDEIRDLVIEEWRANVWPRIVQRGDSWFATTSTSGVTSGVQTVGTPSDLHRAKRLVLVWSSTDREEVLPLAERERPVIESCTWSQGGPKRYVLQGSTCRIYPLPTGTVAAQWTYLPAPSTTTIGGPEGAKMVTALATAITIRQMQDEPTDGLERRYDAACRSMDMQSGSAYHDDGPRIVDVEPDDVYPWSEINLPRA